VLVLDLLGLDGRGGGAGERQDEDSGECAHAVPPWVRWAADMIGGQFSARALESEEAAAARRSVPARKRLKDLLGEQ
jgi:hypothetical protein